MRVDDEAKYLKNTLSLFPTSVGYLVTDGYYYRSKFWETLRELKLNFSGKLKLYAELRYFYTGEQKKRGARRKYDGKLDIHD